MVAMIVERQLAAGRHSISSDVRVLTINLDLPPEERWLPYRDLLCEHLPRVIEILHDKIDNELEGRPFLKSLSRTAKSFFKSLTKNGLVLHSKELKSIATMTGIHLGEIALLHVFYEFSTCCTSIVVNGESGTPLHIRTMDW